MKTNVKNKLMSLMDRPITNLGKLSLFLCFIVLSACDFDEPISEDASHEIDPQLLGTWQRETERVIITKETSLVYYFTSIVEGSDGPRTIKGLMWHTAVGKSDFLMVQTTWKVKPYRYLTYRIMGDVAIVKPVHNWETKFTADTRGSVIDRINRHKNDKDFFGKAEVYTRIK